MDKLRFAMTIPAPPRPMNALELFNNYVQTVQCGWMKCVACMDAPPKMKGRMWLGKEKTGIDNWVTCPVCKGKAEVAQYKHFDIRTGKEIDYERFGKE